MLLCYYVVVAHSGFQQSLPKQKGEGLISYVLLFSCQFHSLHTNIILPKLQARQARGKMAVLSGFFSFIFTHETLQYYKGTIYQFPSTSCFFKCPEWPGLW